VEYTPEYKPVLRYVDAIPSQHEGKPVFLLRDPLGFVEELIAIPQGMGLLLSMMDGTKDLRDIQAELSKQLGQIVPMEEIVGVVKFLDEKGLLWSENFEKLKEEAYQKWFSMPFKPMAHAGSAYPLEEEQAKEFLEELFKIPQKETQESSDKSPRCLIVPHIDIKAGAEAYAKGYARFKPKEGARIIVLGVGHHLDMPYSVLTKDIATPFGLVKNDKGGVFYLSQSKKVELYPDHMAHKLEHSIEFQALFLSYLLRDGFVVLPILMGPLPAVLHTKELVDQFVSALAELVDDTTYIVLGIDFCHLGLRYGDPFEAGAKEGEAALSLDKQIFDALGSISSEEFLEKAKNIEPMKVCGITCLYVLNALLRKLGVKPEKEVYHQEAVPFGKGSLVSVMSAGLYF